jgi:uncharacterized protein (UPF0264 family)
MTRHAWRQGLLVSVRTAAEATVAVAAGAAIIDIKEPARGPLGPANAAEAAAAIAAVAGRAAVTIAGGELADSPTRLVRHVAEIVARLPDGVPAPVAVKAGPAGLSAAAWRRHFTTLKRGLPAGIEAVAVAYADWQAADAPPPEAILSAAAEAGAATLLVDTFDKQGPGLFGLATVAEVVGWLEQARGRGLALAVAGRLSAAEAGEAWRAGADVVGVRTAACAGGRLGRIDGPRVRALGMLLARLAGHRAGGARRDRDPPGDARP